MEVGDPFVRHTAYCFQVLQGLRRDDFSERGVWPSRQPADVDEISQTALVGQLNRWRDLVKKYAAVNKLLDPREMFILALAIQRFPGPILEIGTHRGIATCMVAEVTNSLRRNDPIYTIELFMEEYSSPLGQGAYPGDIYLNAIKQFRQQPALHRVVPIVGNSHSLKSLCVGMRPSLIFMDGDLSEQGLREDLQMLRFFTHPFVCLVHNSSLTPVMSAVLAERLRGELRFANFHTGSSNLNGLVALSRA
jgi:hypothetical protein